MRAAETQEHIAVADVLRAVAIACVVSVHFVALGTVLQPMFDGSVSLGCWAVDAFFILSGFLLGRPYAAALSACGPLPNARRYAARRFLRIWPAYAVVVILSATIASVHRGRNASGIVDVVAHLLMLHGVSPKYLCGAGNAALWTMAVDAQFYLLLPLGAVALSRVLRGVGERRRPAAIGLAIGCVVVCSLVARLFASLSPAADWNDFIVLYTVQRNALGMACAFGAGMLLGLAFVRRGRIDTSRWRAVLAVGVATEAFSMNVAWLWPAANPALRMLAYDVCGTLSASCLLIVGLTLRRRSERFSRFVEHRFVVRAAAIAYAVYLVHFPLRDAVFSLLFDRLHVPLRSPTFVFFLVAGSVPAIVIAAYALHRFVERPFLVRKMLFRDPVSALRSDGASVIENAS